MSRAVATAATPSGVARWSVRLAEGRVARTAHLVIFGSGTLCGWEQHGGWGNPHAYSARCGRCERIAG